MPLKLPPADRRKVHGIIVARGAKDACKEYFGEGIGSLIIAPDVKGGAHWDNEKVAPFVVGDVDPNGPFVHVLDEATLDIVLGEMDTITDITAYLTKKEQLIRKNHLISAAGEEELVAYYMTHMNSADEHDFTKPDGANLGENESISFAVGFYSGMLNNEQYKAKKAADQELVGRISEA